MSFPVFSNAFYTHKLCMLFVICHYLSILQLLISHLCVGLGFGSILVFVWKLWTGPSSLWIDGHSFFSFCPSILPRPTSRLGPKDALLPVSEIVCKWSHSAKLFYGLRKGVSFQNSCGTLIIYKIILGVCAWCILYLYIYKLHRENKEGKSRLNFH